MKLADWLPFTLLALFLAANIFRAIICAASLHWMERRNRDYGHLGYKDQPVVPWFVRWYWRQF